MIPALDRLVSLTSPTLNPPSRLTVSEWATRFRYLSSEYTDPANQGRYSFSLVPFAREPMDARHDKSVRMVVLMWASQLSKTTIIENEIGYNIDQNPGPLLLVEPTVEMAEAWSKERLIPTVRDTPCLREKIADQKSRSSGNTIQLKTFPGGNLAIVGANSPAGLAGRPRRDVYLDEVDRFPASAGTEGDPVALAMRRTESFSDSVIYLTSTPVLKGASRIEAAFLQSDQRYWFVPCLKCGGYQHLRWENMRFDPEKPSDSAYQCQFCGDLWDDPSRIAAVKSGEWRATMPFNGVRGYALNGIYSLFKAARGFKNRLHQMVSGYLEAKKGGEEQEKTWVNTFLGKTWEGKGDSLDAGEISKRCEDYGPENLPEDVILAIAGVDVQRDRLELEVIGLGVDDETWGIEAIQLFGDPEQDDVWDDLLDALQRRYKRSDGQEIGITATAIDMRHKPARVRAFVKSCGLPRVWPVYGVGSKQPLLVTTRWNKKYALRTYAVCSHTGKDTIFARLKLTEPGPRYCHFPKGHGYTAEFFAQLTAEVLRTKLIHGFPQAHYEKIRARNEALDRRVYSLACVDILRPNLTAISRRQKAKQEPKEYEIKPAQEETKPFPQQIKRARPQRQPGMRPSFVKGWRR